MLKDFIGLMVTADFNLNQNGNDKLQLITKGKAYKVLDIIEPSAFLIENDEGRFDKVDCTYFLVP